MGKFGVNVQVLNYLTDADLCKFLNICKASLNENVFYGFYCQGMIFIKENATKKGFQVDKDDASITRYLNLC